MNNILDNKKEPIRLIGGNKKPGGKDRPPNSKVGPGRVRYNKGHH